MLIPSVKDIQKSNRSNLLFEIYKSDYFPRGDFHVILKSFIVLQQTLNSEICFIFQRIPNPTAVFGAHRRKIFTYTYT